MEPPLSTLAHGANSCGFALVTFEGLARLANATSRRLWHAAYAARGGPFFRFPISVRVLS